MIFFLEACSATGDPCNQWPCSDPWIRLPDAFMPDAASYCRCACLLTRQNLPITPYHCPPLSSDFVRARDVLMSLESINQILAWKACTDLIACWHRCSCSGKSNNILVLKCFTMHYILFGCSLHTVKKRERKREKSFQIYKQIPFFPLGHTHSTWFKAFTFMIFGFFNAVPLLAMHVVPFPDVPWWFCSMTLPVHGSLLLLIVPPTCISHRPVSHVSYCGHIFPTNQLMWWDIAI